MINWGSWVAPIDIKEIAVRMQQEAMEDYWCPEIGQTALARSRMDEAARSLAAVEKLIEELRSYVLTGGRADG